MNTSKYFVASIAAAIWLFIYGFVANVIVLGNYWAANTSPGLMRAAALADISLPDTDGENKRLGSLWAEAPAVVVFLRHYG